MKCAKVWTWWMLLACLASVLVALQASGQYYSGGATVLLDEAQLDELTGSIALYPDALVAQILPASTYPLEVSAAGQWLRVNPQASEAAIDAQNWDPSIKALAHYPDVLQMMTDKMDWTQQLGQAFLNQPADVMNSIQRLRNEAQAAGTLVNTPQQQIILDNGLIDIVPCDANMIYVPIYDPGVVFFRHGVPLRDAIRFDHGFVLGGWLNMAFDWHNHRVEIGASWNHPRQRPVLTGKEWHRDNTRPIVVAPRRVETDEHRGYPPRADVRPAAPRVVVHEAPRPEVHVAPEVHPAPEIHRAPEVRPAPVVVRPAPIEHPAPVVREPARAFGADAPRPQVEHEESRGNASMQHK